MFSPPEPFKLHSTGAASFQHQGGAPWSAPPSYPSQLSVSSNIREENWTLPSSVPTQGGFVADDIRRIEEYIQMASIMVPSGESGITFREYTLGRVLVALADFQLAGDDDGRQRTVRSLLQRTVGTEFDSGNFRSYIAGMLQKASAEVLQRLDGHNWAFAESARLLTVEILCFPPLAGLLLATAREVQETVFTTCRALLTRELYAALGEGHSSADSHVVNALFSSYSREFEKVLAVGLRNYLVTPSGTRSLEETVNRLYAQVAAQLEIAFQNSGSSTPPGYVKHAGTSFHTTELLEDLFVLVTYNQLYPQDIEQGKTASQYLVLLRDWTVTAEYYQGLKNPLIDPLPRETRPMIAELQQIANLALRSFESLESNLQPCPSLPSPNPTAALEPPCYSRWSARSPSPSQYTQMNEHFEAGSSAVDNIRDFFWLMLDSSTGRNLQILAITLPTFVLTWFGYDYRAVLVSLAAWLQTHDKPERFNTAIEKLGAYALRGASTGALVAGAMTTPIPHLGQIRYLIENIPIPTDYLTLLGAAAIVSEGWLWFVRASHRVDKGHLPANRSQNRT